MMKTMVGTAALVAGLLLGASTPAMAFGVVKFTEDPVNGFVGDIPTSSPAITVGSDGEQSFDPFGFGADTSDGIVLNANWAPDPAFANAFAPGFWTQIPGTFTWVLPACQGGTCENANIKEPAAKWDFIGGGRWQPGTKSIILFDVNGELSDAILVKNDGPGGGATITFRSGFGIPEPATWAMMMIGFAGIGYAVRRSRKTAALAT